MADWECGECGRMEDNEKVSVKKIPRRLYWFWSRLGKILPFELPDLDNYFSEEIQKDVKIEVRCHHCGKPLCPRHRILILDDLFSLDQEKVKALLPSWWTQGLYFKTSKNFRNLENKILLLLENYHPESKKLRQKAYHCKKCWQEYHPLVVPENEWEDIQV